MQKNFDKQKNKPKKALKSDAAKCVKLTELFSKCLNLAATAEDSSAADAEVRRKQKIQLTQVIFTLLLPVSSCVFVCVCFDSSLLY